MGKQLTLKFLTGPIKNQEFSFDEDPEIIIGRLDECDITLKDSKISSEHCGIFFENGEYFLEDFESTNGTYINTTKIRDEEYVLEGGETIFLGSSKILVKITSSVNKKIKKEVKEEVYKEEVKDDYRVENEDEFELEEDTNIKKIKTNKGIKKFLDIDYYLDLKEKFLALDTTKKLIVVVVTLIFFLMTGLILSKLSSKDGRGFFQKSYSDDSEEIIQLNDKSFNKLFGYMRTASGKSEDFSHPKKVRFKFKSSDQKKITLYYMITKIDYIDEVVIKLNGVEIAKAPLTSNEVARIKLVFPFENLDSNKENIIEFINTKNLGAKEYKLWGIIISKLDRRLLPKPDREKAEENYLKADKLYDQRRISRGNRYKAFVFYQASIDFMELMPDKPDFYDDAKEKIKIISKDFEKIYQDNRYAAIRAFKFQKYEEAKIYINNIIEEIPDEDDSRYNSALKMLNAIP
jgi:pSer/pThr/pTyr-binding forkhead associated (FHA) protein